MSETSEEKKIGILIAGLNGAVGSTVKAGIELLKSSSITNGGLITESKIGEHTLSELLSLSNFENIEVNGWDIKEVELIESLKYNKVLTLEHINYLPQRVLQTRPFKMTKNAENYEDFGFGEDINKLCFDIFEFKDKNKVDNIILVNSLPTDSTIDESFYNFIDIDDMANVCKENHPTISNSIKYAIAAALTGCAFLNFTPNFSIPKVLYDLFISKRLVIAGNDGKTGQTFLKTALAPALKLRNFYVEGWYSLNLLGNNDGMNLSNDKNKDSKIKSKLQCLEDILGYKIPDHKIEIINYQPRGDNKEAWDTIDFLGFLDYQMQLKINFHCRDSVLAAPLVIDISRLISKSIEMGEYGYLEHLSLFFKQPMKDYDNTCEHDLFIQRDKFYKWVNSNM